ncbi:unnamed protein product [Ilex paraguariensis]|uniref:Uncharacterized protein n=1 Tax=Ilex paraguariensis TaxID=185542 RepID=A0ABC8TAC6_9AQUA
MADEPSVTSWSFLFGRKKEPEVKAAAANGQITDERAQCNGNLSNGTSNGNGHVKNTSDLAIYEQFQNKVFPIAQKKKKTVFISLLLKMDLGL